MLDKVTNFPIIGLIKSKSVQNFIFLSLIQASNILIVLISMPLLITSIGVDQFGLVNLALSIIIIANIFVSFGFNLSGPREVAINQDNKKKLSFLLSNILFGKLILAGIMVVIILIAIFGFNLFKAYQTILIFSLLLLFSEATLPLWFFQGLEKMKLMSTANIFSKLLYLMCIVFFIRTPEQSKYVNFLMGGSAFLINLLVLLYVKLELNIIFFKPKFRQLYNSLSANVNFFLSNLTSYLSFNSGLIILSFFSNPEVLGFYSLAEKVAMVIRLFPALVTQSIYPNATKLHKNDPDAFYKFMKKAYLWTISIAGLISLFIYLIAPLIIQLLAKSRLDDAILYLQILAFLPFLASFNIVNVLLLLITNQQHGLFKVSLIVCTYMILMSFLLATKFGVQGVCYTLLSTEIFYFFAFSLLLLIKSPDSFKRFYFNLKR